ncbi:MAG: phosphoribosyltransferase [Pseudomonadota bacterium]|nr:phosphoribosyltransferase [Pseudomonadota bacterium]
MQLPIPNRKIAGQWLAKLLQAESSLKSPIVLALPRGGVPVAYEIAQALNAPLDLLLVRKLGTPQFPELAMGAIASGGIRVLNQQVLRAYRIKEDDISAVETKERTELKRREQAYRGQRPNPNLTHQNIIIVDDGLATGSTMKAAIEAIQAQQPASITVAVPVAPPETIRELKTKVDRVICPFQPHNFSSIGQWYEIFSQVSDNEVKTQLQQAWQQ